MIDWNVIDTVLLDMDGTLLDLHFDNHFWHEHLPLHWSRRKGIGLEQAKQELGPWIKKHEGTLNWYCLDFWSRELDLNIMEIKHEIRDMIRIRHDTELFLEFLKGANKQVVMVTNAHRDLIRMKFEQTDIGRFFDQVFCSHDFGVPKEDEAFWHRLNNEYPFERERSVLVDDNLKVLQSARDYGIGHLVSIIQPDSNKPPRQISGFQAIDRFSEIMPGT
ncbi:MAG: GMP/IMP nucleotidase [Gammaproteobacteria bacterium]|nr:GMP/IMP nucleotidase [Gammaproteobacteria bacterium]